MTRKIIALIGLALLAGCSGGGGGDPATPASAPAPPAQPDMLTATPAGLLRGKASGQGQQLIYSRTNFHQRAFSSITDGQVVYTRSKSADDDDIWAVKTDGTEDRAVVNTPDNEWIRATKGPWMLYSKLNNQPGGGFTEQVWSRSLDSGAQHILYQDGWGISMQFYGTDRVMFTIDPELFSSTITGADRVTHASRSRTGDEILYAIHITENRLIYLQEDIAPNGLPRRLFTVPLTGGTGLSLDDAQFYTYPGAVIGNRIVYHRSPVPSGNADVVSIDADGTDRVVLASHPANEAVQGVTTDQVIIRRNLAGNDHLIAVPATGGAERLLMTMTDSEFVEIIIGDVIVVRRPSGTWTLNISGTLKQLDNIAGLDGFVAVGNAICSTNPVWCMPLDGSAPAVKIANEGKVVGVL